MRVYRALSCGGEPCGPVKEMPELTNLQKEKARFGSHLEVPVCNHLTPFFGL